MRNGRMALFGTLGVPVLGLGMLLVGLSHPSLSVKSVTEDQSLTCLLTPDPKLDSSMTILLREQSKEVSRCRQRLNEVEAKSNPSSGSDSFQVYRRRDVLAQAIADYNIIARECTPAVFESTHLPPAMAW